MAADRAGSIARACATLGVALASVGVVLLSAADPAPSSAQGRPGEAASAGADAVLGPAISLTPASPAEPSGDASAPLGALAAGDAAGCSIADEGFGAYGAWLSLPIGRALIPEPAPTGPYDLVLHFHGAEAARRMIAPAGLGIVLAALDAGEGSAAYEEAFFGPGVLAGVLDAVQAAIRARGGEEARLRALVVTSWSAGYGGVRQILLDEPWRPDAVVLLDSLHASYGASGEAGTIVRESLEPFLELATRAEAGDAALWVTHSDIRPPGYASTTETASMLLAAVDGQRRYAGLAPVAGVEHKTRYDRRGLHVWGFTGTTREAHCAQLRLLLPLLRDQVLPALDAERVRMQPRGAAR